MANFITEYLHHVGTNEVPHDFHRWGALTLLASAASDHVWLPKGASKVRPNLYVFLIGPSGVGKGEAISTALRLIEGFNAIKVIHGRLTAAALIDMLATRGTLPSAYNRLLLATPELAMAVGRGTQADDFIKLLTELYSGSEHTPITERTRMSGRHIIKGHCVTWVAGTTKEWLRDCVTREAVEGGFFARVACVQTDYNLDRRVTNPTLPDDYAEAVARLRRHLEDVQLQRGPLTYTHQALALHDEWYLTRPVPTDESLIPAWKREDDFVRKLSMLFALADGPSMTIEVRHVVQAQRTTGAIMAKLPLVIEYIGADLESDGMRRARGLIRLAGAITHIALARQLARSGVTHDRLRIYVETMLDAGWIHRDRAPRGGWVYRWAGRRLLPADEEDL
jgi:hypothetical protein